MKRIIRSRFFKNTSIYTFSDVLNKMVPFILLPVLTRYLSPSDYGVIALFFVFTGILGVFMTLELNTAISVNFFKITRDELKVYIANILIITSIVSCLILLFFIIFHSYISKLLALPTEWLFIAIVVTLLQFFTTINLVLWQSEQNPIPLGIYQISQTIFNLSLSLILIIGFGMKWEGRLIAVSVTSMGFGILSFSFLLNRNYIDFKLDKVYIKNALKFGLPLLPHSLGIWFRTGIDRVFLTMLVSASATGLYTVGFQIASVIMVIISAFNKAFTPYLYEQLKEITAKQKSILVKYFYFYFAVLLLLATSLSLIAPYIIDFLLGKKFTESQNYVTLISFGFAFYGMYSLFVNYILFTEKTKYLSYITFTAGLLHVGLSYLLISYNGTIGAAQATAIISFITFLFVWWLSQKLNPMPWLGKVKTLK